MRTKRDTCIRALLALLACAGAASCGDERNTPNSPNPLDRTRTLSSLTAPERASYCAATTKAWDDAFSIDFVCGFVGFVAAVDAAEAVATTDQQVVDACQKALDGCRKNPPEPEMGTEGMCSIPADCHASIAESDACLAEVLAPWKALGSCAQLKLGDVKPGAAPSLPPLTVPGPACMKLERTCPGVKLRPPS